LLEIQPADLVISDQFAAGGAVVKRALYEKGRSIRFESKVRAEADIAVAAASILARAEFLKRLKALSEEFGIALPKGATNVIPTGTKFIEKFGRPALVQVAKLHFKTTLQF
jgi:ribonuclease HIII